MKLSEAIVVVGIVGMAAALGAGAYFRVLAWARMEARAVSAMQEGKVNAALDRRDRSILTAEARRARSYDE